MNKNRGDGERLALFALFLTENNAYRAGLLIYDAREVVGRIGSKVGPAPDPK